MEQLDRPAYKAVDETLVVSVTRLFHWGECKRRFAWNWQYGVPRVTDVGRLKGNLVHKMLAVPSPTERTEISHREVDSVKEVLGLQVAERVQQQCTDMASWCSSALSRFKFSRPIQAEFTLERLDVQSGLTIRCKVDAFVEGAERVVIEYKSGSMEKGKLGKKVDFQTMAAAWCAMRDDKSSIKRIIVFLGSKEIFTQTLTASQMVSWINENRGLLKSYLAMKQKRESVLKHAIARPGKHCAICEWVNVCPSAHKE